MLSLTWFHNYDFIHISNEVYRWPACTTSLPVALKPSYHMAGTTPGPWGGHRGNWDDERDPTSQRPAASSPLLWQWSQVLQVVVDKNVHVTSDQIPQVSHFILTERGNAVSSSAYIHLELRYISRDQMWRSVRQNMCLHLENTLKTLMRKVKTWLTCNTWMWRVSSELVLLWVGFSENIISNTWRQREKY